MVNAAYRVDTALFNFSGTVAIADAGRLDIPGGPMCGRYSAAKNPAALVAEFDAIDLTDGSLSADYNVAPTKNVATVVQRYPRDADGTVLTDEPTVRSIRVMRWGFVPFWAKDPAVGSRMINTRSETVQEKPAFRKAAASRRCLVPADGWYEWRRNGKEKEPFYTTTVDGSSMAFAGIWDSWKDPKAEATTPPLITFSILTTDAVGQLADIHHRMPLVLPQKKWQEWLDPDVADVATLLRPPALSLVDTWDIRPVSSKVNSVRNNGPELHERAEPESADLTENALFDVPDKSDVASKS